MKRHLFQFLFAACALCLLSACQHDEPANAIKPVEERTILMVNGIGEIYNLDEELVTKLPNCKSVSQIIVDGSDYFVSGTSTKERVGYWKNGKWNTLHIDFIDDVDHWTYGIGKWDYYIYLLDYPNVLKNSGIFPLRDSENFLAAHHGISVSQGVCRVVGSDLVLEPVRGRVPVMYSERKGAYEPERLQLPSGVTWGDALAVFAYDRNHVIVGGHAGYEPAIWVDKQLHILPRVNDAICGIAKQPNAFVNAVAYIDGHIYAAGADYYDEENTIATVWRDGVPSTLKASGDNFVSSEVVDIQPYGSDLYILTHEYSLVSTEEYSYPALSSVLWMNGKVVGQIKYRGMVSFAVY